MEEKKRHFPRFCMFKSTFQRKKKKTLKINARKESHDFAEFLNSTAHFVREKTKGTKLLLFY